MKINSINYNMNAVIGAGTAQNNKPAGAGNALASALGTGRFDKLDLSEFGQKYLAAGGTGNAQMERMMQDAELMSKYYTYRHAQEAYWEMQSMIKDEISRSKNDMEGVEDFLEELKYYQELLDKNGDTIYIDVDKYEWLSKYAGKSVQDSYISRDELISVMARAQMDTYDKYIGRYGTDVDFDDYCKSLGDAEYAEEMKRIHTEMELSGDSKDEVLKRTVGSWSDILGRKFTSLLSTFRHITGMDAPDQDSVKKMFSREGCSVYDFLAKTRERIDMLSKFSKDLRKTMDDYTKKMNISDAVMKELFPDTNMSVYMREQEAESELLEQLVGSDEETAAENGLV